jgi:hypothetical protein
MTNTKNGFFIFENLCRKISWPSADLLHKDFWNYSGQRFQIWDFPSHFFPTSNHFKETFAKMKMTSWAGALKKHFFKKAKKNLKNKPRDLTWKQVFLS